MNFGDIADSKSSNDGIKLLDILKGPCIRFYGEA